MMIGELVEGYCGCLIRSEWIQMDQMVEFVG